MVLFQSLDIEFDCLSDILDRIFSGCTLADAAWEAWTLSDPHTVFTWIDDDLPHVTFLSPGLVGCRNCRIVQLTVFCSSQGAAFIELICDEDESRRYSVALASQLNIWVQNCA